MFQDSKAALVAVFLLIAVIAGVWLLYGQQPGQQSPTTAGNQTVQNQTNETLAANVTLPAINMTTPAQETVNQTATTGTTCSGTIEGSPRDNYTYKLTGNGGAFTIESDFVPHIEFIRMGADQQPIMNVTARRTVINETGNIAQGAAVTKYVLLDDKLACYEVVLVAGGVGAALSCADSAENYTEFRYCIDDLHGRTDTSIAIQLGTFFANQYTTTDGSTIWFSNQVSVPLKIVSSSSTSELISYSKG